VPLLVSVPALVVAPLTVRVSALTFRMSPLSIVREPAAPAAPVLRFTVVDAVPMVTASELVGTPALQLVEVFQLPPLAPVQESAVSGGTPPDLAAAELPGSAASPTLAPCSIFRVDFLAL
jgi:hypothetical protein